MTNKISVIMLTYNREKLARRMIGCVIAQTFRDFEFIIVDNGSTDRSGLIAGEYAERDGRISVIRKERGNIGSGRNAGLDAAKGEWVAFVDDDDRLEPDYLEFLLGLAVDNNADIAICGADKDEDGVVSPVGIAEKVILSPIDAITELMRRKRFNNGFPTKIFRRGLFEGLRFPESGRYDDIHLMYKILGNAKKTVSYGLPKYHVLRHGGNNSFVTTKYGMITPEYLSEYREVYRKRTLWLTERFPERAAMWWYFDWSFLISMVHKCIENNLTDCEVQLKEIRRELNGHQEEFTDCKWAMDFERKWMERYVISGGQPF